MKKDFVLTYLIFLVAQIILSNYFHFTPYILLSILPALIFCIPTKVGTFWVMIIAFASGLAVDYFAEGVIGINALALVPVAYFRRPVIGMIFGSEPFEQKECISIRKYGFTKVSMAVIMVQTIFMAIYICADCSGTRPWSFMVLRLVFSVLCSYLVSMVIVNYLTYDTRR